MKKLNRVLKEENEELRQRMYDVNSRNTDLALKNNKQRIKRLEMERAASTPQVDRSGNYCRAAKKRKEEEIKKCDPERSSTATDLKADCRQKPRFQSQTDDAAPGE